MISRVAENCFWLFRYLERAENMARLVHVNRGFQLETSQGWHPVLVVSGEDGRYPAEDAEDGESVQEYLTWDRDSPVGIVASLFWARENARMIRELISLEMWESINAAWQWLQGASGRKLYRSDRDAFYRKVKDSVALVIGISQNTLLRGEPLDFMRLGMMLERAGQTARIMDVKYHLIGPTSASGAETAVEVAHWIALLRSCSAADSFSRQHQAGLHSSDVIRFLLKEERFPRSVYYCLTCSATYLGRIEESTGSRATRSGHLLRDLVEDLRTESTKEVLESGLHAELTRIIDTTAEVCEAIHSDFFNPTLPEKVFQEHPA